MNYYIECWKKYATFSGRARRKEYWMFVLFSFLAGIVASVIDGILGTTGVIYGLYGLAALIPAWAVMCRRFHDAGHSGWCWLWLLVPIVGAIVVLVFLCTDSVSGENQYGPSPKTVA